MNRITEKKVRELFYQIHWPDVDGYAWAADFSKEKGGWALNLKNLTDNSIWNPFGEQRLPTKEFYQFIFGLQFCLNGYMQAFIEQFGSK